MRSRYLNSGPHTCTASTGTHGVMPSTQTIVLLFVCFVTEIDLGISPPPTSTRSSPPPSVSSCLFSYSLMYSPPPIHNNKKKIINLNREDKAKQTNKNIFVHTLTHRHIPQTTQRVVLANYSWAWVLPWIVVGMSSDTPPEKNDAPFPRREQLQQLPP